MIKIKNLLFQYSNDQPLFDQLNLHLQSGKIYGLLGKNGAGKTTLLNNILGLQFPKQGKIKVMGYNPVKRRLKFLQDSFLLAEEIYSPPVSMASFVRTYTPFYPSFDMIQFHQFLNEFEISHKVQLKHLSMGQKKKVMIAFALACNTRLLIMDEPTNGLDIPSKKQFRKILSHIITTDRLFIMSTHQIRDLHSLIDTVVILEEGKVIFNQDIMTIEKHLSFVVVRHEPQNSEFLYYERVPGGYFCVKPKDKSDSLEVDIEVLFNAIVSYPKIFTDLFKNCHHAQ